MMFAFGFATLGDRTRAMQLVEDARCVMQVSIPASLHDKKPFGVDISATIKNTIGKIFKTRLGQALAEKLNLEAPTAAVISNFAWKAFKYRVDQAIAGKPHAGSLSPKLLAELERIASEGQRRIINNPYLTAEYMINRIRNVSRIIEPEDQVDPYAKWTKYVNELERRIGILHEIQEPEKLKERIRILFHDGINEEITEEVQFRILREALWLSFKTDETFVVELLGYLLEIPLQRLARTGQITHKAMTWRLREILDRSFFLAGHFNDRDHLARLTQQFSELACTLPEETRFAFINQAIGQCLRSLKKLGLRSEIDQLLTKIDKVVLGGDSIAKLRERYALNPVRWSEVLRTQLSLACGWLMLGQSDRSELILADARYELLDPQAVKLESKDYSSVASTYVTTLCEEPKEIGVPRIIEFFRKMDSRKITNSHSTASFYSQWHLTIIDDLILAFCRMEPNPHIVQSLPPVE